jgi:hypothetical protein
MPVMTAMAMESAVLPVLVKLAPFEDGQHGQAGAADRGHRDVTSRVRERAACAGAVRQEPPG